MSIDDMDIDDSIKNIYFIPLLENEDFEMVVYPIEKWLKVIPLHWVGRVVACAVDNCELCKTNKAINFRFVSAWITTSEHDNKASYAKICPRLWKRIKDAIKKFGDETVNKEKSLKISFKSNKLFVEQVSLSHEMITLATPEIKDSGFKIANLIKTTARITKLEAKG